MVGKSFRANLENPFILETSMLVFVESFCLYSGKTIFEKTRLVEIDSRPSPSYNMLKITIGSFHGFGTSRFRHGIYRYKLGFSVFPYFGFLLVLI